MKVAIVCDWLTGIGGAERVVLELHKLYPDAPIYTSQYNSRKIDWFKDADVRTGWLQKLPLSLKKFLPVLRAWYFSRLDLSGYDLVISSSGAEAKFVKTIPRKTQLVRHVQAAAAQGASEDRKGGVQRSTLTADRSSQRRDVAASASGTAGSASRQAGAVHVSYCHAPTHYYWSRYQEYMEHPGFGVLDPLARLGLKLLLGPMRRWDYKAAQRPDYIIANSNFIKDQIKKYYGRDSVVIHPPVDIDRFKVQSSKFKVQRKGFLIAGRQTPYKRFDLPVAACTKLDLPLTVIGHGPDHKRLTKLAGPTIKFLERVDDRQIIGHFQSAAAFLFPGLDDFGIVAVEALSAGTPVIAYKAGGALDYIIPGKNGLFFDEQSEESLSAALKSFSGSSFNSSEVARSADNFSPSIFHQKMADFIKNPRAE